MQQGQIFRRNGSWYVRYYQDEIEDGAPVRKRVCKKLARYSDDYRSKKDLAPLLAEILSPVNSGDAQPEGSLTLTEFVEQRYLPSRAKKLRPSTMRSYRDIFRKHVETASAHIRLRDFHTKDGQHLFRRSRRGHAASLPPVALACKGFPVRRLHLRKAGRRAARR